jgi:hypothetical protein
MQYGPSCGVNYRQADLDIDFKENAMKQYMEQGTPSAGYYEKYETSAETMPAQWVLVLVSGVLAGLALLLALVYWWQFGQADAPSLAPMGGMGRSVIAMISEHLTMIS